MTAFRRQRYGSLGVMAAIPDHGLNIPGDIALVGFDDVPVAK
jgi:DNA-binding LacI/PurR family transcriptional regulator